MKKRRNPNRNWSPDSRRKARGKRIRAGDHKLALRRNE